MKTADDVLTWAINDAEFPTPGCLCMSCWELDKKTAERLALGQRVLERVEHIAAIDDPGAQMLRDILAQEQLQRV